MSSTRTFTYDGAGNRTEERDGADNPTTYGFDAFNRVATVTDPLERTTTYGYDKVGNRTSLTDPASGVTVFAYDAADQLDTISYSSATTPDVDFGYDNLGRRTSMADGTGTSTYAYDSLGRLTSSTNGAGATVGYAYDLANNLTTLTYPGSQAVIRAYDDAGRWTSVTDWASRATTFGYDVNDNLTSTSYPNLTTATKTYDAADRLTSIDHAGPTGSFATFAYTRDDKGQLASTTPTGLGANETNTYTDLDQLESVNSATYGYDAADNLTQLASGAAQGFDAANQLCWSTTAAPAGSPSCASPPTGATTYSYDSRGNRTATTPPSGPTSYGYDQANRLTATGDAAYAYDGDGVRASKTVSSATTAFTWSVAEGLPLLLAENSVNYVYGPGGLPIERVDGLVAHFYHHDQLGSTRVLTDLLGLTAATSTFDAYGNLTASTGSVPNPFGFAGEYTDAESGLVYLRARYYDPATGQFLSRDPLEAQTREPYGYVNGNPLNETDPSGLAGRVFRHYSAGPRPPGMSETDYRAYLSVVEGMNAATCKALNAYRTNQAEQARSRAFEARLADQIYWSQYARNAEAAQPTMWADANNHTPLRQLRGAMRCVGKTSEVAIDVYDAGKGGFAIVGGIEARNPSAIIQGAVSAGVGITSLPSDLGGVGEHCWPG